MVHSFSSHIPLIQSGATPLHIACEKGHSGTVNTLIKMELTSNSQRM